MRPGEQARVLAGGQSPLESVDGLTRMSRENGRPGQNKVGAGVLGDCIQGIRGVGMRGKRVAGHGAGRGHVAGREARLGQIQSC